MKGNRWLASTLLLAVNIFFINSSVNAQNNSGCFWTNSQGEQVRIPSSMCGSQIDYSPPDTSISSSFSDPADIAFIDEYEKLSESQNEPIMRHLLLRTIQQSPESEIRIAKQVCNDLRSGLPLRRIIENQVGDLGDDSDSTAVRANIKLVTLRDSLAVKNYCPEFMAQIENLKN